MRKSCIIILGPTAVGKTSLAIDLAKQIKTEIISADSRQCFREMSIGVAKPSPDQLAAVRHHFIDSHSIQENVNAAVFESYALNAVNEIFQKHDTAIMVGGTGLYIKAFCEGLDEMPEVRAQLREEVISNYKLKGIAWLRDEIEKRDPVYASTGEMQNPQRMMRALEVKLSTGKSIREFQQKKKVDRDFNVTKIGLELPTSLLKRNIDHRVDEMMDAGLLAEVKQLYPYRSLNALQTVGYRELFEYLDGKIELNEAANLIKSNTRQYAKRQMTWFRKDKEIKWFDLTKKIPDLTELKILQSEK
jgi:tRNA dimethylallyltransferase